MVPYQLGRRVPRSSSSCATVLVTARCLAREHARVSHLDQRRGRAPRGRAAPDSCSATMASQTRSGQCLAAPEEQRRQPLPRRTRAKREMTTGAGPACPQPRRLTCAANASRRGGSRYFPLPCFGAVARRVGRPPLPRLPSCSSRRASSLACTRGMRCCSSASSTRRSMATPVAERAERRHSGSPTHSPPRHRQAHQSWSWRSTTTAAKLDHRGEDGERVLLVAVGQHSSRAPMWANDCRRRTAQAEIRAGSQGACSLPTAAGAPGSTRSTVGVRVGQQEPPQPLRHSSSRKHASCDARCHLACARGKGGQRADEAGSGAPRRAASARACSISPFHTNVSMASLSSISATAFRESGCSPERAGTSGSDPRAPGPQRRRTCRYGT